MNRKLRFLAAALSAASVMSCMSFSAYADRLKAADGLTYRYSDSGESKGLFTGWAKTLKGYYYYLDGKLLTNKWLKVSGVRTYYVDGTGRRVTGVNEIKGTKYFFGADGKLINDGGDEWHITADIAELTDGYIQLSFTQHYNETGDEYVLCPSYCIERKADGEWVDHESPIIDADDYVLDFSSGGKAVSAKMHFMDPLPVGEYRITVKVGKHGDDHSNYREYHSEFAVTKTAPDKRGI